MSDFRIDKITNRDGSAGTQICGVSTFSGTTGMQLPSGPAEYRGGRGRMVVMGGYGNSPANSAQTQIQYLTIATTGNSKDFGDMTVNRNQAAAASNGHGGL